MAGGYLTARPLREPRPGCSSASRTSPRLLVRFADLAPVARSLRSHRGDWGCLISHASLLTRARHAVPLQPSKTAAEPQTSSFRAQSRNPCTPALQLGCCDYAQHDGVFRAPLPPSPTPFTVFPHPSLLTPHPSPLTPHPSPLPPHPSPLTPHSSPLTPHPSPLPPHPSPLTPPSSPLTPHPSPLTPHPSLLTPHSYDLTPPSSLLPEVVSNFKKPSALAFSKAQGWHSANAVEGRGACNNKRLQLVASVSLRSGYIEVRRETR